MDQDDGKVKKVKNKSLSDSCGNLAGFWRPEVCEAAGCWLACGVVVRGKLHGGAAPAWRRRSKRERRPHARDRILRESFVETCIGMLKFEMRPTLLLQNLEELKEMRVQLSAT